MNTIFSPKTYVPIFAFMLLTGSLHAQQGLNTFAQDEVQIAMFTPEIPEVLFEDYGIGYLTNGTANIEIDPVLAKTVLNNGDHHLKVFIQLEDDCNGVYVSNQTATGFIVKELEDGKSNAPFSYHVIANRGDNVYSKFANHHSNNISLHSPDMRASIKIVDNLALELQQQLDENDSNPEK